MQKSVLEILNQNAFSFSAEIIPPRNGTDFEEVFSHIHALKEADFHFISVTHGAGGSLRGGTLPIAHHAQTLEGLTAIAHLTVRGATREDLENHLIDHHYFGIHNILALRGDPPDGLDETFVPASHGYTYAHELVEQIAAMNRGEYLVRKNFDKDATFREGMKTSFCIGVAAYPEDKNDKDILYLEEKAKRGAHFAITQMVYDINIFENFYAKVVDRFGHSFPVLPGIRIPASHKQLERMKNKFGIAVPGALMNAMREAAAKGKEVEMQTGLDWATDFVRSVYEMGVRGIHIFVMGKPESAIALRQRLSFD